jgi:hypothetical protein
MQRLLVNICICSGSGSIELSELLLILRVLGISHLSNEDVVKKFRQEVLQSLNAMRVAMIQGPLYS